MERWVGRTAIVTGASAGIGASIAEELAKAGVKVFGLARRLDRLEENAKKLTGIKGSIYPIKCDITKEEDILAAFKIVEEQSGGVDILINNAGISRTGSILDGKTEDWKEIIDTNLVGLCICTREAVKSMRARGVDDGHIININSVAGHCIPRFAGHTPDVYPATKHGVTALTESLRHQLRDAKTRIKVTSISPGYVNTEIAQAGGFDTLFDMNAFPALESIDIANGVLYVLGTPPHVQVHELTIKPIGETF